MAGNTIELQQGERFGPLWSGAKRKAAALFGSLQRVDRHGVSPLPIVPVLSRALQNPESQDHNGFHIRNVQKHTDFLIRGLSQENRMLITPWLDSIALFGPLHDADQLLGIQRNEDELRGGQDKQSVLNVKKGHGRGAATMILALADQYAVENGLPLPEAKRICAGAAMMMLRHDDILSFSEALRGDISAEGQSTEDLNSLLLNGTLNQFTLSPKNIVELTRLEKAPGENSIGLHPAFEATFSEELAQLAQDLRPLLADTTGKELEGLRLAADIALAGDILDMVIPPEAALVRLFLTQYSQNRPFHVSGHREEILQLIRNGNGNGNGEEMKLDSDVYRVLWQAYRQDTLLLQNPLFANNTALRNLLVSNALSQVELFRLIGHAVMSGDYTVFDKFASEREAIKIAQNFAQKPLEKGGQRLPVDADPRIYTEDDVADFDELCNAVYEEIRIQNPIEIVTLGQTLDFQGATSTFHEIDNPGQVVKQYLHGGEREKELWDFIPIGDPEYRTGLIRDEINVLGILAQSLNAVAVITKPENFWNGWFHDVGIKMDRLNPESFNARPTSEQYREVARYIIDYHFNPEFCPEVDLEEGESMETFIRSLLLGGRIQGREPIPGEIGILRDRLKEEPAYLEELSQPIEAFLNRFGSVIAEYGVRFHEPIMAHGDIKMDNMAVNGGIQILDVAPWVDWRINSKRMDAAFLYADLLVHGEVDEAEAFWGEYDRLYRSRIGIEDMDASEVREAELGIQAIDAISMVYRYLILYRLYKNKANGHGGKEKIQYEANTQEAYKLLNIAVAHLTEMTETS